MNKIFVNALMYTSLSWGSEVLTVLLSYCLTVLLSYRNLIYKVQLLNESFPKFETNLTSS